MNKEMKPHLRARKLSFIKALVMVVISLYCFAASAQNAAVVSSAATPVNTESKDHSDLAEFVKNYPNDFQAALALRYATMLANPQTEQFSQSDIDRMKSEQQILMMRFNNIREQIKNGVSYERANALYEREMNAKAAMDQNTNSNKTNQQPAVETAPVMLNGNGQ